MKSNRVFNGLSNYSIIKIEKVMGAALFIFFLGIMHVTAGGAYSQSASISLTMMDARVEDVLDKIESDSEFFFLYNEKLIDTNRRVDINADNVSIKSVLAQLFEGSNVGFEIADRKIVLFPQAASKQQDQTKSVSGKVTDESGEPLPGVTVFIMGTTTGVVTDVDGQYYLSVPKDGEKLQFSFIGMAPQEFVIGGQTSIDVVMRSGAVDLDEVVVTGVGSATSKKKLGFTVESVNDDLLDEVPAVNVGTSLAGKMAGIKITQASGAPGEDPEIQLRGATAIFGTSSPLIIIDGTLSDGSLSDINMDDVEKIEVVKGAAASSLYGSRAANGVINIVTKRGRSMRSGTSEVIIRSQMGTNFIGYVPPKTKATQYIIEDGKVNYDKLAADGIFDNVYPKTTNVNSQLFENKLQTMNTISFRGNSDDGKTGIYTSAQYTHEPDIIKINEGFDRMSFKANLDHSIKEHLNISASNNYTISNRDNRNFGWDQVYYADPDVDFLQDNLDGSPYLVNPNQINKHIENPLYAISNQVNETKRSRFIGNYALEFKPVDYLDFKFAYGVDYAASSSFYLTPKGKLNPQRDGTTTRSTGSISKSNSITNAQTLQFDSMIKKRIGDFTVRGKLQYLYEYNAYESSFGSGSNLAVGGMTIRSLDLADPSTLSVGSYEYLVVANNLSGVVFLDYKDRYIFDALLRYDGVSLFGSDVRWNPFYRVSGAYRVSEDFKIEGVDELKLRLSYGTAGLRPPFEAQYEVVELSNGAVSSPKVKGNSNLQPWVSDEIETGFDVSFLNRFNFSLTYALTNNKNQIMPVPVSATSGFLTQYQNAGNLRTNVWEAVLNANLISKNDFTWDAGFTFDRVRQKIVELHVPGGFALVSGGLFRVEEGASVGDMYGRVFARSLDDVANQVPAGGRVEDYFVINNHGYVTRSSEIGTPKETPIQIKDDDGNFIERKIGNTFPDFNLNFNTTFSYKGFSVYALFTYQHGGDVYNHMRRYSMLNQVGHPLDQSGLPENEKKPFAYFQGLGAWNNEYFVEDATHLRLQEISAGYTFNLESLSIKELKLGIVARNLFVLTKYSGYDPNPTTSSNLDDLSATVARFDISSHPMYSNVAATVTLKF